ncbi:MAG: winged helix DNA-binding domain-containing protein [Gaiellaceae bacterium]
MIRIAADKVIGFRLRRHMLDRRVPGESLVETARALCGVHAQLASSAELALWARMDGIQADDVRTALERDRTLVKTWAMRGTLHLLPSDDLPLYVAVLGPRWADPGSAWLRGFGLTNAQYDAILDSVPRALGARPRTREQLADKLAELAGPDIRDRVLSGWGALLKPSARRGDLCFGPNRGRNVTFVRPDRWLRLRALPSLDSGEAARELVRRYLAAYGPATADDLGRWLGVRGAEPKRLLRAVEDDLVEVEVAGRPAWALAVDLDDLQKAPEPSSVRLLPAFDPYVVGFRPRELFVAPKDERRVFRPQAWLSPVVLVDGRAAGVWERELRGRRLDVRIEPFARLTAATRRALSDESERLAAFLGATVELSHAA